MSPPSPDDRIEALDGTRIRGETRPTTHKGLPWSRPIPDLRSEEGFGDEVRKTLTAGAGGGAILGALLGLFVGAYSGDILGLVFAPLLGIFAGAICSFLGVALVIAMLLGCELLLRPFTTDEGRCRPQHDSQGDRWEESHAPDSTFRERPARR